MSGRSVTSTGNAYSPLGKNRGFRLFCIGSLISMLGDQLTLITLPWLAIYISPDPSVMGIVLALLAVPMSVFLLFGGAIVDRFSSRRVLLFSKYASLILFSTLALLVYLETLSISLLYILVFLVGSCTAFAVPAGASLLPSLVKPSQLPAANSIGMMLRSSATIAGPLIAAFLLGVEAVDAGNDSDGISAEKLGFIFAIDAATFAISACILHGVRLSYRPPQEVERNIFKSIADGFRYICERKSLCLLLVYMAVMSGLVSGPIQVGLPLLVKDYWQGAPGDFGLLMSSNALGIMLGMLIAARFSRIGGLPLGFCILLADAVGGSCLLALPVVPSSAGYLILAVAGIVNGYAQVLLISWIQQQIRPGLLGRVMSIVMFFLMGLAPLSAAISGFLLRYLSLSVLFTAIGACVVGLALAAMRSRDIRMIRLSASQPLAQQDKVTAPATR